MNRRAIPFVMTLAAMGAATMAHAEIKLGKAGDHVSFDMDRHTFLAQTHVTFDKLPESWAWVSDVEHIIEPEMREHRFLADGEPAYIMGSGTIPAGKYFELFPYHYYDKWEVEMLGGKANYRLAAQNRTDEYLTIELDGMGTTRDWEHWRTWHGALSGNGKKTITLAPGEVVTLWEEKQLEGGLPWSGIFLGKASGDLYVVDYCYIGDEDPGFAEAEPMPNIAWPPYLLASFSRGSVDWNAADLELFPAVRNEDNRLPLSKVDEMAYSIAFAYSPGGPITNLCLYKEVSPTFARDTVIVNDPVDGRNHPFFGGNYPIMYRFTLNLHNDTEETREVSFHLASNDIFGVDSLCGVWIEGEFLHDRARLWKANTQWRVFTITLKPGESHDQEFTVVPLGSRWGGLIGSFQFNQVESE
ncbi:MAG: hypothetical protein JJU11_17430 [Candidatus Sumerlaeia bacterium]|nr:hypothetical protein [Candidatus Sumerlaeia bacterium]